MNSYNTPSPVTAVLDIPAGRIQVIAADRTDTVVDVRPADPNSSRDAKAAAQVSAEYADGVLRVAQAQPHRLLGNSGAVEVTVQLPAGSTVQAKTASAEFRTVGRLGQVTLDAAQATVKVDEAAGARLAVQSGDVTVGRLAGDSDLRTTKGDITVTEAGAGHLELRTEAGTVTVTAAAGVSAALDAGTGYGRTSNALKNTAGTPELTIRATIGYGDINASSL